MAPGIGWNDSTDTKPSQGNGEQILAARAVPAVQVQSEDGSFSVATWNVNGIRAREEQFLDWLQHSRPDVVCLQEIKARPAQLSSRLLDIEGYASFWHGTGGYSGVALHVRRTLCDGDLRFFSPEFDFENRIVAVNVGGITVASVYVPNGGKDFEAKLTFFCALDRFVQETIHSGSPLLVCGDLNITRTDMDVHPGERRPNKAVIGQLPQERAMLETLLSRGMVDVARHLHPDDDQIFTWWAPWRNLRARNIGWRIDYVLCSADLATRVQCCDVERAVGTSDHAPVVASFRR